MLLIDGFPDDEKTRLRSEMETWMQFEFGAANLGRKFARWLGLHPPSLALPGKYHELLREVEGAYISGDSYPALTGQCAWVLGRRPWRLPISRLVSSVLSGRTAISSTTSPSSARQPSRSSLPSPRLAPAQTASLRAGSGDPQSCVARRRRYAEASCGVSISLCGSSSAWPRS
jgi:hypothetical protein